MVKENNELVERIRKRGLTCNKLKSMEKSQLNDAKKFRSVGFENIAKTEESIAKKINSLRKKVCLLK